MIIRPARSAALLAAALAGTTLAFAPAPAPAPATPATQTDSAFAATVIDGQAVTTVRGLSDRTGFVPGESPTDLVSWVRANRRIIEASGLATMAATDACAPLSVTEAGVAMDCEEPDPGEGGEDGSEEFTWSYADTAGDLDGDGWDEVLEITLSFGPEDFSETTTVRSGRDGTELWTISLGDEEGDEGDENSYSYSYIVSAPDIDGDGGQDLLRVAVSSREEYSDSCTPLACEFRFGFSDTMVLTALQGATGEELGATTLDFSLAFEDSATGAGAGPAYAAAYDGAYEVVGGLTGLDFVDSDGDGAHQLLVGTVDLSEESTGAFIGTFDGEQFNDVIASRQASEASSEVTLLDLATGERTIVADEDDVLIFPVGVTLDGRDAIVIDRFSSSSAPSLYGCVFSDAVGTYDCASTHGLVPGSEQTPSRTLLDGDLDTVWTAPVSPYSLVVFEAGGDLDGDGGEDLLDVLIDIDTWELETAAVSGVSGAELWTAPIVGGVVDGDDLLGVSFAYDERYDYDGYDVTITAMARRFDGATGAPGVGAELGSIEVFERDGLVQDGWLGVSTAQLDGVGVDLATEAATYLFEETASEEYCWEEEYDGEVHEYCETWTDYEFVSSEGTIVGSDGATMTLLFERDLSEAWLSGLLDLDRDGRDDLLLEAFDTETFEVTTVAERTDGTVIWTLEDGFVWGALSTPEGWWLVTHDAATGAVVTRDGADLSERWRFGGYDGDGDGEVSYQSFVVVGVAR